MLSYENLDRIADAYNPLLGLMWLLLSGWAFARRGWRAGLASMGLGLATLIVAYGLMAIDNKLKLWSAMGLDYSTHTAVAFAVVATIVTIERRLRIALPLSLLAYCALMLYQRYHSVADMATTMAALTLPIGALAYALRGVVARPQR